MYFSLHPLTEWEPTVNPSTHVSAGSSPAAPIPISEHVFHSLINTTKNPLLRKFYALDCSNKAQSNPLLFYIQVIPFVKNKFIN